ncbi:MAG: Endoribonuclease [Rhodoglobus sp.]|nr:Endoribonuclease [Rhodoglobus sp.]
MRIVTDNAPAALPVFSQGVRKGQLFSVSGQGGADAAGEFAADAAAQTTRALENVRAILVAGGATFDDVVMLRVYLTTRDDYAAMNEAYAAFMAENVPGGILPARTTVFTGLPLPQMLVEIDALAAPE